MSLVSMIGPRPNLFGHQAGAHKRLEVAQPVLSNADIQKIRSIEELVDGGQVFIPQHAAQQFDLGGRPRAQIGEGAVLDLPALAVSFPQQDGRPGAAIRDGGDVHANILRHSSNMSSTNYILHVNIMHDKRTITLCVSSPFSATEGRNFSLVHGSTHRA